MASKQRGLTLPGPLWAYVDDLRRSGLYGSSTSAVLRFLIYSGVQTAIGNRTIKLRQFDLDDDGDDE